MSKKSKLFFIIWFTIQKSWPSLKKRKQKPKFRKMTNFRLIKKRKFRTEMYRNAEIPCENQTKKRNSTKNRSFSYFSARKFRILSISVVFWKIDQILFPFSFSVFPFPFFRDSRLILLFKKMAFYPQKSTFTANKNLLHFGVKVLIFGL